jgi:hypothetical protein
MATDMQQTINQKLQKEMENMRQNNKRYSTKTKITNAINNNTNCAMVENYTDTQVAHEVTQRLSKVLKYNLHHKHRKWIDTLNIINNIL